jgi:hypothetical protein
VQKKKEQGNRTTTREEDEEMVPAIFKDMDLAENSDGFDSCEEIEFPVK